MNWLSYGIHKCHRVICSVLCEETWAFAYCFDFVFVLRQDICKIIEKTLPLTIVTDSERLLKTLVKFIATSEWRLMIDNRAARKAFEKNNITKIGWFRFYKNISDGLTKVTTFESSKSYLRDDTVLS